MKNFFDNHNKIMMFPYQLNLYLCHGNSTNITIEKIKIGEINPESLDLNSVNKRHAVFL